MPCPTRAIALVMSTGRWARLDRADRWMKVGRLALANVSRTRRAEGAGGACEINQLRGATPVGSNFQTCPHAELGVPLAQEAENGPRLGQHLVQFPQRGDRQAISTQLPRGEAHATLGALDPEKSPLRRFRRTASRDRPRRAAIWSEESMSGPASNSAAVSAPRVYASRSAVRASAAVSSGGAAACLAVGTFGRSATVMLKRPSPFRLAGPISSVSVPPVRAMVPALLATANRTLRASSTDIPEGTSI